MGQNSATGTANPGSSKNDKQPRYFTSQSERENTFFNYAADAGVPFTKRPLIADSVLHREHVDGDKPGTKNGAYILHTNGNPAGWFILKKSVEFNPTENIQHKLDRKMRIM